MLKSGGSGGGSKPVKRWFALLPDFVLYSFKSAESSEALTATPIPGHTVMGGAELRGDSLVTEKERDKMVKLFYAPQISNNNSSPVPVPVAARKVYYLMGNSSQEMERYLHEYDQKIITFACFFLPLPIFHLFVLCVLFYVNV